MHRALARRLFVAAAVAVFAVIVASMVLTDRSLSGDDEGLFNVIQEYSISGRMIYPLHGQPEFFTIHPPVHYFVTAVLFNIGVPLFHAAAIPVLIFIALSIAVTAAGPFSGIERSAVLAALAVAFLVFYRFLLIRPEPCIVAAWSAGLFALEAARRTRWAPLWCLVGAFATSYASVLHYWAAPAIFAVASAFIMILVSGVPRDRKIAAQCALVCGCFVVLAPFIVFFLVPLHKEILDVVRGVGATDGGIVASVKAYFSAGITREGLLELWPPSMRFVAEIFALPVYYFKVRFLVVAVIMLWISGASILFLIWASLLPAFVIFFVSRKFSLLYMGPELLLYAYGICVFAGGSLIWFVQRLSSDKVRHSFEVITGAAAAMPAIFLIGTSIAASEIVTSPFVLQPRAWFIMRDTARRMIVGSNALIATNSMYDWYRTGGTAVHQITRWGIAAADLDGEEYRCVDAFVILSNSLGNDRQAVPLPWFYVDRQLHLIGGVIYGDFEVLYARRSPSPRPRFALIDPDKNLIYDLAYDPDGDLEIVTYVSKFRDGALAGSPVKAAVPLEFSSADRNTWLFVAFLPRTQEAPTARFSRTPDRNHRANSSKRRWQATGDSRHP